MEKIKGLVLGTGIGSGVGFACAGYGITQLPGWPLVAALVALLIGAAVIGPRA